MAVAILLIAAALARRPYWTGALAGLLPWLRPDLAPLAGLMFAFALWHEPSAVRARAVGIAALVFCPWPAWLAFQGGGWIPQTMKAKAAFFAENCLPLSTKMTMARERLDAWAAMFLPALLLAAAFLVRSALGWISILASAITLSAYTWMLPGGLSHNAYRYVYPIGVPLIALGIALALENRERIWRITFALVFVASMLLWPRQPWNSLAEAADREAVGAWIREHADPHATILVHDAGGLAVFTPNPLVDLVGLKTPSSIAQHERFTAPSCGADRGRAVAAIARASGAEYFVVALDWDGYFKLTGDLQDAGFRLQLVRAQPPGVNGYRVYRLEPPLAIGK